MDIDMLEKVINQFEENLNSIVEKHHKGLHDEALDKVIDMYLDILMMKQKTVEQIIAIPRATMNRLIESTQDSDNPFPQPYRTSEQGMAFKYREVKRYIDNLKPVNLKG